MNRTKFSLRILVAAIIISIGSLSLVACGNKPSTPGPNCRLGCACGMACISCRYRCSAAAPIIVGDDMSIDESDESDESIESSPENDAGARD
jgi:hypothetical protein